MSKRCVIIGGGDCSSEIIKSIIKKDDYIICADSGYDYIIELGIVPSLLIGDFDSIKSSIPQDVVKIKLPVEKDITDSEAAINEGISQGCDSFILLGGTGGRFEHTFANISLMAKTVKQGYKFEIIDFKHKFTCIHNSEISIERKENQQISVFSFGDKSYGVTEKGFHYLISDYILDPFEPIGISNDIVDKQGIIKVKNGTLLIIETKM